MTFSEAKVWLSRIMEDPDMTHWNATDMGRAINKAIIQTAKLAPSDLLGILMGKSAIVLADSNNLPTDFLIFKGATVNDKWCTRIQIEEVALLSKNPFYVGTTDSPKCYIWENTITVSPTSATANLYYVKNPTDLSANDDECPLNEVLDVAVIYQAASILWSRLRDDKAKHFKELFLMQIKEVRGE